MKKSLSILAVVIVALAAGVALAAAHHGPESIVIEEAAAKKGPVTFPHHKHQDLTACDTCHHVNEGMTADNAVDADVQKCSACHLNPDKADTPDMSQMSMKKNPFHMLCIDCHKTEAKGPTKCDDCHAKK